MDYSSGGYDQHSTDDSNNSSGDNGTQEESCNGEADKSKGMPSPANSSDEERSSHLSLGDIVSYVPLDVNAEKLSFVIVVCVIVIITVLMGLLLWGLIIWHRWRNAPSSSLRYGVGVVVEDSEDMGNKRSVNDEREEEEEEEEEEGVMIEMDVMNSV